MSATGAILWTMLLLSDPQPALGAAESKPIPTAPATSKDDPRAQLLASMRQRSDGMKVVAVSGADRNVAKRLAEPLFRYGDQQRKILDATIWGWGAKGRPIALCKIERYEERSGESPWLYCLASLSTEVIDIEWAGGRRWASTRPGLSLRPLPDGPTPADAPALRLRQLKEISRRFAATSFDTPVRTQQELRLLVRPIVRYANAEAGMIDGAIFGLTDNGTNPAALLVVELQKSKSGSAWSYGVAGMTQAGLSLRLDGSEVWSKPYTREMGSEETWVWFREAVKPAER